VVSESAPKLQLLERGGLAPLQCDSAKRDNEGCGEDRFSGVLALVNGGEPTVLLDMKAEWKLDGSSEWKQVALRDPMSQSKLEGLLAFPLALKTMSVSDVSFRLTIKTTKNEVESGGEEWVVKNKSILRGDNRSILVGPSSQLLVRFSVFDIGGGMTSKVLKLYFPHTSVLCFSKLLFRSGLCVPKPPPQALLTRQRRQAVFGSRLPANARTLCGSLHHQFLRSSARAIR